MTRKERVLWWLIYYGMKALLYIFLPLAIVFSIWNYIDCFNRPIASAPARCLMGNR